MRKVFFIDIDGVLVTPWSFTRKAIAIDAVTEYEPYPPEAVAALNLMIKAINPILVIHSSRRYQYSMENFRVIWREVGIEFNNLSVLERYSEIDDKWFNHPNDEKAYDIRKYIVLNHILDDNYLVLEDEKLAIDNIFLLNGNIGLQLKHAESIIQLSKP